MKTVKPFIVLGSLLFILIIFIPTILVLPFSEKTSGTLVEDLQPVVSSTAEVQMTQPAIDVAVYRTKDQSIENIPLEQYVIGVVASEMPADFEMEALKAQALTARTYIVGQLLNENNLSTPEGAKVTDSTLHQVYKDTEELKAIWGSDYQWKMGKITEAVRATTGQIITYKDIPIDASFFSTSNGFTENSEDYWVNEFPYLRSVESPWDELSPKFLSTTTISVSEFEKKLGVKLGQGDTLGKIMSRTKGNRVGKIKIGEKELTGRNVREALGLPSSDFSWERKGNQIVITTKGYGHGVGMSQYGANGMAKEGKTYKEIVAYYYQGIHISNVDPYLPKLAAQK